MWKHHLRSAMDSLGTVFHMLKEEHSNVYVQETENAPNLLAGRVEVNGNNPPNAVGAQQNGNQPLPAYVIDFPASMMEPNGGQHVGVVFVIENRGNTPLSDPPSDGVDMGEALNLSVEENNGSNENPSWASEAFKGASNIANLTNAMAVQPIQDVTSTQHSIPSGREFHDQQFPERLRANDPTLFHLNASETPPPSPGREMEDYEFNMQPDLNGMIPDIADVHDPISDAQDNNNMDHICEFELCNSFDSYIATTTENVQDKQSILKEILQHIEQVIMMGAEDAPENMQDQFMEIHGSVFLINNCLDRSCTVESFRSNANLGQYLVVKIKNMLETLIAT